MSVWGGGGSGVGDGEVYLRDGMVIKVIGINNKERRNFGEVDLWVWLIFFEFCEV